MSKWNPEAKLLITKLFAIYRKIEKIEDQVTLHDAHEDLKQLQLKQLYNLRNEVVDQLKEIE